MKKAWEIAIILVFVGLVIGSVFLLKAIAKGGPECETPCGNARSVENRVASAISAQSSRCITSGLLSSELFQLTAADFNAATDLSARASAALCALHLEHGGTNGLGAAP